MTNPIIIEMISDYINVEFDLLTEKHVLFKNGIVDKAPPGIESALRNMKGGGERVRMPGFEIETTAWQNRLTPPTTPNTVASTPNTATTYATSMLTMMDEYGIKVARRKPMEWSEFNKKRNVWAVDADQQIAKQLAQDIVRNCFDSDLHQVLRGAIPAANYYDATAIDPIGIGAGTGNITIHPQYVVNASGQIDDNMDELTILIMHSKVWRDYKNLAYTPSTGAVTTGGFAQATLLSDMAKEKMSIWLCDNKIVYVTDRCYCNTGDTGGATYHTYLLAQKQLQLAITTPFKLVLDLPSALMETRYIRADVDYVPHLKGMEYIGPVWPTPAQLGNIANWQLGRYPNANMVKAVCLITN